MSTLSRVRRRFREDGISGLTSAFLHRVIAPLHVPLVSRDGTYLMERNGVEIDLAPTRLRPLLKYRMKIGFLDYEAAELDAISTYLDSETDVIELGAGVGYISCVIDQKLSEAPKHIAVEANPNLIQALKENRERNGAEFEVRHAAYSPTDEKVTLNIYDDYRSSGVYSKTGKAGHEVTVDGVNLASLVEEYDTNRCTLVADIEGVEANLILEEWEILRKHFDTLIIEFHSRNPDTPKAKSKLSDSDFEQVYVNSDVEVWTR